MTRNVPPICPHLARVVYESWSSILGLLWRILAKTEFCLFVVMMAELQHEMAPGCYDGLGCVFKDQVDRTVDKFGYLPLCN